MNVWLKIQEGFYNNFIFEDRWHLILIGLGTTIYVTLFAIIVGTILGATFCLFKISKFKILNKIGEFYVYIIRGTPTMIQLIIIYFGVFGSIDIPKEIVAIIAFGINSGAYMTEIMRGGILSVNQGQTEAGRSLGLSHWQTMMQIILPQAFKNMLPTYTSEVIVLLKETAIVGIVGLKELTGYSSYIQSRTYSVFYPFLAAAVLYLALTTILSAIFSRMERKLRESDKR